MKNANSLWTDENNNSWNQAIYTEEQAMVYSKSLINCVGCTDCIDCIDCKDCVGCTGCEGCTYCKKLYKLLNVNNEWKNIKKGMDKLTNVITYTKPSVICNKSLLDCKSCVTKAIQCIRYEAMCKEAAKYGRRSTDTRVTGTPNKIDERGW